MTCLSFDKHAFIPIKIFFPNLSVIIIVQQRQHTFELRYCDKSFRIQNQAVEK